MIPVTVIVWGIDRKNDHVPEVGLDVTELDDGWYFQIDPSHPPVGPFISYDKAMVEGLRFNPKKSVDNLHQTG